MKADRDRRPGGSRLARPRTIFAVLLVVVACVVAVGLSAHPANPVTLHGYGTSGQPAALTSPQGALAAKSSSSGAFRIAGSIRGLYPGDSTRLVLTVINTRHFGIVVTSISTRVHTSRARCSASNLTVHKFVGHLKVPARRSVKVSLPVRLSRGAPNACQGVAFPLTYSGLARRRSSRVHPRPHHRPTRKRNRA